MEIKEVEKKEETNVNADNIDRMFAVGAHYGYSKSRRHPSIKPYIFGVKNWVEIIDLEKTNDLLSSAKEFAKQLGAEGKTLLFVGSKNEAKSAIQEGADSINMPHVTGRWIGGTITNFSEIKKRTSKMDELSSKKDKGELAQKYTKKEQVMLGREISNLKENFFGIKDMTDIPNALFVVDTKAEMIAMKEAKAKGIPVIGLLNSDSNINDVDYPIVANDANQSSIKFFIEEIISSFEEGVKSKI